jgi:fido (protein-threonine AMPylation protein)
MASAEEFVDPYLDPETGILRNKVGARTQAALNEAEGDLTFARLVQLMDHPPKPTGDLDELRAIHRHLFQDLYEWAGELRVVKLRKRVKGGEFFLHPFDIGRGAGFSADELRRDNMLRGMNRDRFIDRLACHYGNFNHVHPFREGNGRTQRVFWSRVARDAGWQIDWRRVRGKTNNEACRAARTSDRGARCSTRLSPRPHRPAGATTRGVSPSGRGCRSRRARPAQAGIVPKGRRAHRRLPCPARVTAPAAQVRSVEHRAEIRPCEQHPGWRP